MSLYALLFAGSTPVGGLVVGLLAAHEGVPAAVAEMAGLCMLGVVAALVYAWWGRTRLLPDGATSGRGARREPLQRAPGG